VDTEDQSQLAQAAGITSIPTIMGFRGGILVFSQPGALNESQFEQVITSIRELDMDKVREEMATAEQN
jgi:thioredoxin